MWSRLQVESPLPVAGEGQGEGKEAQALGIAANASTSPATGRGEERRALFSPSLQRLTGVQRLYVK